MISTLTRLDRVACAAQFDEMFRARAVVFRERLGWDVRVCGGREIDRYDTHGDPIYLVTRDADGRLSGSLRLLPTSGDTMLGNEFAALFDAPVTIRSASIWECTRFCVHPRHREADGGDARHVSSDLQIGLCAFALSRNIEQIVGLYDARMTRVYRRIGWTPAPLAAARPEAGNLILGIWKVSHAAIEAMQARADGLAKRGFTGQAA